MQYNFIPSGSSVSFLSKVLYLDVGNKLCKGIIDHHHLTNNKSATHLVFLHPTFIPQDIKQIILHQSPDLDCIAASFLVEYYLLHNKFPKFTKKLISYVDKNDFGQPFDNFINIASIFIMLKATCNTNIEIVNKGHKLLFDFIDAKFNINVIQKKYYNIINNIKKDHKIYQNEIHKFIKTHYNLPLKQNLNKLRNTKALIMIKPQAKLFKEWARLDGYDMLIVQWNNNRIIISVKADGLVSLKGIGNKLNNAESNKRKELNIIINENNRIGYNIPDPWYDGRAHGYTIIDSPRRGTALDLNTILTLIKL